MPVHRSKTASLLTWNKFGNGHVIFDASKGKAPNGADLSETDANFQWVTGFPSLMGWNGVNSFGVRVDRSKVAEQANAAVTDAQHFGISQTWQDVKASRDFLTTYTNTTGKPICVVVTLTLSINSEALLLIDGVSVNGASTAGAAGFGVSLVGVVKPGGTYSVSAAGTSVLIQRWSELR